MDLLQTILNAQGGQTVDQLGGQLGLNRAQTVSAIESLLPALAGGLAQNVSQPGGLESLQSALMNGSHQRYVDDPSALADPTTIQDGNGILGHVLGSKDVSRQLAANAAAQTGIGSDVLKRMLPMLASVAMGVMAQRAMSRNAGGAGQSAGGGGLMDVLGPMLGGAQTGNAGGLGGLLGSLGGLFRR